MTHYPSFRKQHKLKTWNENEAEAEPLERNHQWKHHPSIPPLCLHIHHEIHYIPYSDREEATGTVAIIFASFFWIMNSFFLVLLFEERKVVKSWREGKCFRCSFVGYNVSLFYYFLFYFNFILFVLIYYYSYVVATRV